MNFDTRLDRLENSDLIEIDEACDRFEALLQTPNCPEIDDFVTKFPEHLRSTLQKELEKLSAELNRNGEREQGRKRVSVADTEPAARKQKNATQAVEGRMRSGQRFPSEGKVRAQFGDRFEWIAKLGSGGAAVVWKAKDCSLDRLVAVKIPHGHTRVKLGRFLREARLAAKLQHPNIVSLFEVIQEEDNCLLVTQLVQGESLAEALTRRRFSVSETLRVVVNVLEALQYSHEQGVIHRDLKPHNILLDEAGEPFIADFGLATSAICDERSLTRSGEILGTPAYMSPEQTAGEADITFATDIYSTGVILFQMLTGDLPFRGTIQSVMHQVIHRDPPALLQRDPDLPADLNTVLARCLEKQPQRRFDSAQEFRDELMRILEGRPILSRPISKLGLVTRWAQRHRSLATAIAVSLFLLAALGVGSVTAAFVFHGLRVDEQQLRRDERRLRLLAESTADDLKTALEDTERAQIQERTAWLQAANEAQFSSEVAGFLESLFESTDPIQILLSNRPNSNDQPPNLSDLLLRAENRLQEELLEQPLVRARLMDTIGNVCRSLGYFERGMQLFEKANLVRQELLAVSKNHPPKTTQEESVNVHAWDHPAHTRIAVDTKSIQLDQARHQLFVAQWYQDQGQYDSAIEGYEAALSLLETASDSRSEQLLIADLKFHYGRLLLETRRNEEARESFEASLQTRQSLLGEKNKLVIAAQIGRKLCDEDLAPQQFLSLLSGIDGDSWEVSIAKDYSRMLLKRKQGDLDEAILAYQNVIQGLRRQFQEKHPIVILARGELAGLYFESGNYKLALFEATELTEISATLAPQHPKRVELMVKLAQELLRANRVSEAHKLLVEVSEMPKDSHQKHFDVELGLVWTNAAQNDFEMALKHLTEILPEAELGQPEKTAWIYYAHSYVLDRLGRSTEAEIYGQKSLAECQRASEEMTHPIWLERCGIILSRHHLHSEAEPLFERALESERTLRPEGHPRIADRMMSLATCLLEQQQFKRALTLLDEATEIRANRLPIDDHRIQETKRRRAQAISGIASQGGDAGE